ncbi:MAG: hypothetical protein D6730_12825 [Bacteroidetes bacterium]|nr:MAG: hypothetical protein D6730_12825 [Bacteroidota bacterium]
MKTIRKPLLFIALACLLVLFLPHSMQAQDEYDRTPQHSVDAEIAKTGGNDVVFTVNYDARFWGKDGLGIRIGIGGMTWERLEQRFDEGLGVGLGTVFFYPIYSLVEEITHKKELNSSNKLLTVPVSLNYLAGIDGKYVEAGLGLSYFQLGGMENGRSIVRGTATLGFRYQPVDGGLTFRISWTPIFGSDIWGSYDNSESEDGPYNNVVKNTDLSGEHFFKKFSESLVQYGSISVGYTF